METNNPFEETINTIKENLKNVDEITRKQDEEESGSENKNEKNESKNEDNTNPAYILYNSIASNSIDLLQDPTVVNTFKKLSESVGEDVSKSMVEMFAIMLTQSAHQALLLYDALLKKELDAQFMHFAKNINANRADINAHHSALTVFKKQLDEISSALKIKKFESENKIK